jgi:hypothetical protein
VFRTISPIAAAARRTSDLFAPRWNVNSARKLLVRGIKPFSKALGAVGVTDKLNIYGDILLVVARN